jgi:hypothetical protein
MAAHPERLIAVEKENPSGFGGPAKSGMTGGPPALPPMCRKCGRVTDITHKFCPHCGQRQDLGAAWYYHPVWILVLAFTVLGPFALPLVWRSKQMSAAAKALTTAAILLYAAYAVYLGWQMGAMYWKFSTELGDVMREIHPR